MEKSKSISAEEMMVAESKKLFGQYDNDVRTLLKNPGARHPTREVWVRFMIAGRRALKYDLLLSLANVHCSTTQETLKRIFERGLDKEFEYWRSNHARVKKEQYEFLEEG